MRYCLVTEDRSNGYKFWREINSSLWGGRVEVVSSGGINNFTDTVLGLELDSRSVLMLMWDNVNNSTIFQVRKDIQEDAEINGYTIIESRLFCFEEIFLSFQSLPKWCGGANLNAHEDLYDIVKNSINRLEDYSVQAKIAEYMSVYNASASHGNESLTTRERFAGHFLELVTGDTAFRIKKTRKRRGKRVASYLSPCWYADCLNPDHKNHPQCCKPNHGGYCGLEERSEHIGGGRKLVKIATESNLLKTVDFPEELKSVFVW